MKTSLIGFICILYLYCMYIYFLTLCMLFIYGYSIYVYWTGHTHNKQTIRGTLYCLCKVLWLSFFSKQSDSTERDWALVRWTTGCFPATLTCLTLNYSKLISPPQVSYLSVCYTTTSSTQVLLWINFPFGSWVACSLCTEKYISNMNCLEQSHQTNQSRHLPTCISRISSFYWYICKFTVYQQPLGNSHYSHSKDIKTPDYSAFIYHPYNW